MAVDRKNGWVVVQAVLSMEEYKKEFLPKQKEARLSESSFIRERLALPPKESKKGKSRRGKRAPAPRDNGAASALPFVGHRVEDEGRFVEEIDESKIPPHRAPEDAGEELESPSRDSAESDYGLDLLK